MSRRCLEAEYFTRAGIQMPAWKATYNKLELVAEVKYLESHNGIFCMQFDPKGEILAVGYGSGGIQLFKAADGAYLKQLRASRQSGHTIMALHFHPTDPNILYAASSEGHIYIFDVESGELKQTIEEDGNEINCFDFSTDGYFFATGGKDLKVRVYRTESNRIVNKFEGYQQGKSDPTKVGQSMRVFCLKFHVNNPDVFLCGGWDDSIKVWDCRKNDASSRVIHEGRPHICGDSLDMRGNTVLCGQWKGQHALVEYDYTNGNITREIEFPHKGKGPFLYAAQYANDQTVLAGGSGTNSAHLIELGTNRVIGGYESTAPIQAVDSALNGNIIAVGGMAPKFAILRPKN